jgi:hypothetical protein
MGTTLNYSKCEENEGIIKLVRLFKNLQGPGGFGLKQTRTGSPLSPRREGTSITSAPSSDDQKGLIKDAARVTGRDQLQL